MPCWSSAASLRFVTITPLRSWGKQLLIAPHGLPAGAARQNDRKPIVGQVANLRAIVNRALVRSQQLTAWVSGEPGFSLRRVQRAFRKSGLAPQG